MLPFKRKRMQLIQEQDELNTEFCGSCNVSGVTPNKCDGCGTYERIREIGLALDNIAGERKREKIESEERLEKEIKEAEVKRRNREMAFTMNPIEFVELRLRNKENGKPYTLKDIAGLKGVSEATIHAWKKENASVLNTAMAALNDSNNADKKEDKIQASSIEKPKEAAAASSKNKDSEPLINREIHNKLRRKYDELKKDRDGYKDSYQKALEEKAFLEAEVERLQSTSSITIGLEGPGEYELKGEIDRLKREVVDAHKLVTEWQERNNELEEFKNMAKSMYADLHEDYEQERQAVWELQKRLGEADEELQHARALLHVYLGKSISIA